MSIIKRKNIFSTIFAFAAIVALAFVLFSAKGDMKAHAAATLTASDFNVAIAVREVDDEHQSGGIRFKVRIEKEKFETLMTDGVLSENVKTGVLVTSTALAKKLSGGLVLENENADGVYNLDTTDYWKSVTIGETDYYESTVAIYDVPTASSNVKLAVMPYVTKNGETLYRNEAGIASMADAVLQGGSEAMKEAYIHDYTVTYYDADRNPIDGGSETVAYGETITEAKVTAPSVNGKVFDGWKNSNGSQTWVFGENGTKVTGNTNLYATYTDFKLDFADGYGVNTALKAGDILSLTDLSEMFIANATVAEWKITNYKENGESKTAGESITVNSGSYYEFVVTAAAKNGTTDSKYVLIKADDCYLTTFDTLDSAGDFVCNELPVNTDAINNTRAIEDIGYGDNVFTFSPGSNKQMSCNWLDTEIPVGVYNIRINFRFDAGLSRAFIATDGTYSAVKDGQDIYYSTATTETTYDSLTLFGATVSDIHRYGFLMWMNTTGKVYVESIQFVVPDFELDYNTGYTVNKSVAANTEVAIGNMFKSNYPTTDYTLSVTSFRENGETISDEPASITVASGEYYELIVHGEYTGSRTGIAKTVDKYILIKAADCYLTTFDNHTLGVAPTENFVCNGKQNTGVASTRTVEDIGYGNRAFTLTPGSSGVNCNWVAIDIPAGTYNIKINFKFEAGFKRAFIATDDNYNAVKNGQDIFYSTATTEATYGSLTLSGVTLNGNNAKYPFQIWLQTTGKVHVESIQFIPVS